MRTTVLLLLATTVAWVTLVGQTMSRSPLASPVYPLKASANGHYLTDSNGVPFLLMGDSPQSMIANLTPVQMSGYMANRRAMDFNSILVDALCTSYTGGNSNGTAYDGTPPFTSGTDPSNYDLSTPNPAYFAELDALVSLAASYNLAVLLDPIETGGWLVTLENNGPAKAYNYGVYLGSRYRGFANIVWHSGNDFQSWNNSPTDNNLGAPGDVGNRQYRSYASANDRTELRFQLLEPGHHAERRAGTLDACYTYFETYDCFVQSLCKHAQFLAYYSLRRPTTNTRTIPANYPGPAGPARPACDGRRIGP